MLLGNLPSYRRERPGTTRTRAGGAFCTLEGVSSDWEKTSEVRTVASEG